MHLAEITLGMREDGIRIPYDACYDDIYFNTDDLLHFAILHAEGSLSEEEVSTRVEMFFANAKQNSSGPMSMEAPLESFYSDGDGFLGVMPEGDPSYFRLSKPEAHKLYQDIGALANSHGKLVKAMLTIGVLFRVFKSDYAPTAAEIDAIQEQISTYAEQTEELSVATDGILDALHEHLEALDAT